MKTTKTILSEMIPGSRVSLKKIENGFAIFIDGQICGNNAVRKDYVKAKPTDRIRTKRANVWSDNWDQEALRRVFPHIDAATVRRVFSDSQSCTRRLDASDVESLIRRAEEYSKS